MMLQTGSCHCFPFFIMLFTLLLNPLLAYVLNNCTIDYSDNVTAGVSVDCSQHNIVSVPDYIPRDVISLRLSENRIKEINRTDFYHLSNLRELSLSSNLITHVEDGAFVNLVELKVLYMGYNRLTILTDNMFQGLSKLLFLSLRGNKCKFANPPAAFLSLTSLQELSLDMLMSNQFTDIITVLPHLQVLEMPIIELESFQIKDLPFNMTSKLRTLKFRDQSKMKRFSITTAAFPYLETIDLRFAKINLKAGKEWEWDIPDKYFLRNITKVYVQDGISFNSIRKALQSLDSLECLELMDLEKSIKQGLLNTACKIPTLRVLTIRLGLTSVSEILTSCTQLTNLNLSLNFLIELPDSIKQMKQLSDLNIASNKLSKVPEDVKNLSMLQILDLHNNRIYDLSCSDFLNLTRLTHLHLDNNHISELKLCVFQHLTELKVLTVSHNSIWTFGDTFKTGLQKLELLDLNENVVSSLSQRGFTGLKSLKQLDMEIAVDGVWNITYFEGLDELETLMLFCHDTPSLTFSPPHEVLKSLKSFTIQFRSHRYDPFEFMSNLLSNMKHLENFTVIDAYYYTELPDRDTFKHATRLKTLTITNTNLPYLNPETFDPIQDLEVLDLSKNEFKSLEFLEQANLTRVFWLDLSQNELTVINSVSVFRFLPALRYLNMAENPFACNCSNYFLQQWMLKNKQTQVLGAHSYTCGFPLAKKGTRFLDFDYHSCEQMDASFICYISSTCVIVLTLLTSFTYHFLRLHLFYGYYLFLAYHYDAKEKKKGTRQRYDAFISYNVHDELWVCNEMLPVLEGEQGWRLCLHHRDFEPGKPIIENITNAIYGSRKIICVISHHYLESEWCSREFQMASYRLFDEQKDVLILVFLQDIPAHQLSPYYHMKRLVKSHTYLSWPQAGRHPGLFWQNLRRALDTPDTDRGSNE